MYVLRVDLLSHYILCVLNVDAFRERPVHEDTFRRNASDREEVTESAGRLRQRDGIEKEPLQLFENARRSQHGVYRGKQ